MTEEELFIKNKPLIKKVIKDLGCKYKTEDEYEEYVFYGILGLLNAIRKYKSDIPTSSSYFYTSIKNSILHSFIIKTSNTRKINYMYLKSFDEVLLEDSSLYEVIPDTTINLEEDLLKKEQYEFLYKALDKLKPSYKKIICENYGIGIKKKTLDVIAKESKVSRQAINVKKKLALKKLKKYILEMEK